MNWFVCIVDLVEFFWLLLVFSLGKYFIRIKLIIKWIEFFVHYIGWELFDWRFVHIVLYLFINFFVWYDVNFVVVV